MCIGIPMQVIVVEAGRALCSDSDRRDWVDIRLVDTPAPGSWLLVFAGAARELISAERAAQVRDALRALQASAEGDHARIDNLFSDLVNREPTLPPHLQAQLEQHNKGDKE
ncbi:HypC/HybG/HupF family hydrogenase formation chaperone [Marinobacterium litorale]|uniref:HypC/HybG/HupF family hydrogenase formation chaperone n=1 Tax=Marinobacterium litorale TaxID=404770 RepID=UPI0004207A4F|nr:HypC/HybG/HupF family hydrogenase formation chaperone [Marinobacterium litorale]